MEWYRSINTFLKEKFGERVYKISLGASFTCPNRDGTKSTGGCIFCNPESNHPGRSIEKPISEQLESGVQEVLKRHHSTKFIAYLQHYSNTYADSARLKKIYAESIAHKDIVGLAVSTRPDCLDDGALEALKEISQKTFLWVELGLQTANDATLQFLERHHTKEEFVDAARKLRAAKIMTCAHMILGLPNEKSEDVFKTVALLNDEQIDGVKIHNLHVLKNTRLEKLYNDGALKVLELDEYASLVVDCLERFSPQMLIHRFNSHSPRALTVAPLWSVNKLATLNAVHSELARRDTFQGKLFHQSPQHFADFVSL